MLVETQSDSCREIPVASDLHFTDLRIGSLLDAGIRVFIDLRRERNLEYEHVLKHVALKRKVDVEYFRFPIFDFDVPSVSMMKEILDTIDRSVEDGKPVYFHCMMGLGRTGVVFGCWLARHKKQKGKEILELLSNIRKEQDHLIHYDSPQTKQQKKMVLSWEFGK